MEALFELLDGLGLTKEQRRLIMRAGWVVAVSGHIAWVCGFLGVVGLSSPFARADDVNQLATAVQSDRAERMEHEVLSLKQDQCKAEKEGNHAAVQLYAERLQEMEAKYYLLTHREARVPSCAEL